MVAQVGGVFGGAGVAALRIHHAVRAEGIASRLFTVDLGAVDAPDDVLPFPRTLTRRNSPSGMLYRLVLKTYTTHRPADAGLFSYTRLPIATPFPFDIVRPDVIHLHWIAQGLDYRTLFDSIPAALPVVWTLHDME